MADTAANNRRIAKNTLMLYVRMLLMMGVTLYTSRVVLDKLGIVDYGIYNVVGGIIGMLGFITSAMGNAVQRYLSFEMGAGNSERVNRIFNISLIAHSLIALLVFIIMEIAGVWYLNTYMNIPEGRIGAANWVLQCSILTTLFSIVQVPYNAMIIAKEQMSIYAYVSILEVSLKLAVVYFLGFFNFDRLKLYSVLVMIVTVGILVVYRVYCMRKYTEVKFCFIRDRKILKEITGFAGWNMLGELSWAFTGQGVNLILNLFFGPAVNTARGLADQVNGAVSRFITNFQVALNPQLVKTYAAEQVNDMKKLLYRGIRFSYYLLFVLSLPLILNMEEILHIWLKEVPEYTIGFCQLVLIASLVSTISNLLSQVARAYGKIKKYQILVSLFLFMNFPLSYLVLKLGASPLATMVVNICIQALLLFVRLYLIKGMIDLSVVDFCKSVLFPIFKVTSFSAILPVGVVYIMPEGLLSFIVSLIISLLSSMCFVVLLGMNSNERLYIKELVNNVVCKIRVK